MEASLDFLAYLVVPDFWSDERLFNIKNIF